MTTALIWLESALLALLALFVVALLRGHAEILRRLAAAEARLGVAPSPPAPGGGDHPAADIAGQTLAGDTAKITLRAGSPTTLVAFLSSGCAACGPLWQGIRAGVRLPAGARLVLVAKGPQDESVARLRELAPAECEVLMSSAAWVDYAVPASPHFVLVDGASGLIAGRGTAGSWEQIASMVSQAIADASIAAETDGALERSGAGLGTAARAARAEQALAAAGIGPGHPSLHAPGDPRNGADGG